MTHKPDCYNYSCGQTSSVHLSLPTFGVVYFCAFHGLINLKRAPEALLDVIPLEDITYVS